MINKQMTSNEKTLFLFGNLVKGVPVTDSTHKVSSSFMPKLNTGPQVAKETPFNGVASTSPIRMRTKSNSIVMSTTNKSATSVNNLPFNGGNGPILDKGASVADRFGVNVAVEAAITGKTVATPGLFGGKPKFFGTNTASASMTARSLSVNPRPMTYKPIKNRSLVMSANALADSNDTAVLPDKSDKV